MAEKLKAAKALHQSSKELKPVSKNSNDKRKGTKNFKGSAPGYHLILVAVSDRKYLKLGLMGSYTRIRVFLSDYVRHRTYLLN